MKYEFTNFENYLQSLVFHVKCKINLIFFLLDCFYETNVMNYFLGKQIMHYDLDAMPKRMTR